MATHTTTGAPVTVDGVEMIAEVEVTAEMIEVPPSMLPEPDPDWQHTDANGHRHYWSEDRPHYPTLGWLVDEVYWCVDCHDEHEQGHWACRECGVEVTPGTRPPSPFPTYLRGATTVTFTVPAWIDERVTVVSQGSTYEAEPVAHEMNSLGGASTTLAAVGKLETSR